MSFYSKDFSDLKVLKDDNVLWIGLDNPKMRNAITDGMIDSIERVFNHANFDNDIRVAILYGEGKSFCAGGDLRAMEEKSGMFSGESNELRENYQKGIQRIPVTIESFQKPIIAMVNGAAIGAGCDIACMCDIRVGSQDSFFGETFAKLGLVPGDGGTYFLPRVVGYAKAMEMFLTGELISGDQAKKDGLLNFLYSRQELKDKTTSLAHKIASHPPIALQMTKKALKFSKNSDLQAMLDLLGAFQGITQRSDDHFRALEAFKEKKK